MAEGSLYPQTQGKKSASDKYNREMSLLYWRLWRISTEIEYGLTRKQRKAGDPMGKKKRDKKIKIWREIKLTNAQKKLVTLSIHVGLD